MILVSVFDKKAGTYAPPMHFKHLAGCLRSFQGALENPEYSFSKFPEDFDLYEIGQFDEKTGQVLQDGPPMFLESMVNLKPRSQSVRREGNPMDSHPLQRKYFTEGDGISTPEASHG